ncbi:hypothetical protein A2U01_0098168, partial [Trifolium medium]|nr:hypothetical protein [Trifolium medium]
MFRLRLHHLTSPTNHHVLCRPRPGQGLLLLQTQLTPHRRESRSHTGRRELRSSTGRFITRE